MSTSSWKFYVSGVLKELFFTKMLQKDNNFDIIDIDGGKYVPKAPNSPTDLTLPGSIWFKYVSSEVGEAYYGDKLLFRFDRDTGNLIYGLGDINTVPITAGGTGAGTVEDALTALGITVVGTSAPGTGIGQVLRFIVANTLPALDGSALINLPTSPSGEIRYFAMETPPDGYLKANGSLLLRASYPILFDKIGVTYGAGDGTTTFRIPDARGLFIRGWDDGRGIDISRVLGSDQTDAFKQHGHRNKYASGANGWGSSGSGWVSNYTSGYEDGTTSKNFIVDSDDVTAGTETRPKNIAFLACIKY